MVNQLFQLIDLGRRQNHQGFQFVVKLQRQRCRQAVSLCQIADQSAVRLVHQEGADDDAAQQFAAVNQGKCDVVQVRLARKNIGLSQHLGRLSRLHVQAKTFAFVKYLFLQNGTVGCGLTEGHNHVALAVNQLDCQAGKRLQIAQNRIHPGFRHEGKNTCGHIPHLIKRQNPGRKLQYFFSWLHYTTNTNKKQTNIYKKVHISLKFNKICDIILHNYVKIKRRNN